MKIPFETLGSIATALGAPAPIVSLVSLGLQIGLAAKDGVEGALAAKDLIERMVAEGRDPTEAEWGQLQAVTDALLDRQRAALAAAEADENAKQQGLQPPD